MNITQEKALEMNDIMLLTEKRIKFDKSTRLEKSLTSLWMVMGTMRLMIPGDVKQSYVLKVKRRTQEKEMGS